MEWSRLERLWEVVRTVWLGRSKSGDLGEHIFEVPPPPPFSKSLILPLTSLCIGQQLKLRVLPAALNNVKLCLLVTSAKLYPVTFLNQTELQIPPYFVCFRKVSL